MHHPTNGQTSSSSSSSSSSTIRDRLQGVEPQTHQVTNVGQRPPENFYSRHSTWVHPALAFQNQLPPTFQTQFPPLSWRKGKWTEEEEFYVKKLIDAFNGGYLKVPSGTTLRSFLAERLCCDPMRITKKFAGSSCIGKQVFTGGDGVIDETKRKEIQEELKALEKSFMSKIDYHHKITYPVPDQALAYVAAYHPGAVASPYLGRHPLEGTLGHGHGHHLAGQNQIQGFPPLYYGVPPPHQLHHRMAPSSTTSESTSDSGPEVKIRLLRAVNNLPPPLPLTPHQAMGYPYPSLMVNMSDSAHIDASLPPHPQVQNPLFVLRHPQGHHAAIILPGPNGNISSQLGEGHAHPQSSLVHGLVAPYRPRQAHSSADLFGRQYPTTIEQMNFLSSENLRRKLAADKTVPPNGFHVGGRMGMGDAAKFCSAAAHAYSEKIEFDDVSKRKQEVVVSTAGSETRSTTDESVAGPEKEARQVDLEASDLLLNFFNAAGSTTSKGKKNEGSVSGSSGSGSTSNQGEQDGDDSVSNFSDAVDGDLSASVSGRSSSLSSDRSDSNSDIDYSSHDDVENECKSVTYSPKTAPRGGRDPVEKRGAAEYHLAKVGVAEAATEQPAAKVQRTV